MASEGSVTRLIPGLKEGDENAVFQIFERFQRKAARIASVKLGQAPRRVSDEEDVVVESFRQFFAGVGTAEKLNNRDDLWKFLGCIIRRQAINQFNAVAKSRVKGESAFGVISDEGSPRGIEQIPEEVPSTEELKIFDEDFDRLLGLLDENHIELRPIALLKLTGYSNSRIAEILETSEATVRRRLGLIREIWGSNDDE